MNWVNNLIQIQFDLNNLFTKSCWNQILPFKSRLKVSILPSSTSLFTVTSVTFQNHDRPKPSNQPNRLTDQPTNQRTDIGKIHFQQECKYNSINKSTFKCLPLHRLPSKAMTNQLNHLLPACSMLKNCQEIFIDDG